MIYVALSNAGISWCSYHVVIVTLGIKIFKFIDKSFICYYFINISEVHTGPYNCAYFYPWSMRCSDGLHNLVLRLKVRPYSGLVEKVASPNIFLLMYIRFCYLPIEVFSLTRCTTTPCTFDCPGISGVFDEHILLRAPLWSRWSFWSLKFLERVLRLLENTSWLCWDSVDIGSIYRDEVLNTTS